MKKIAVIAVLAAVFIGICFAFAGQGGERPSGENASYLRVHIRANSNSETDQAVKYRVRDKVVEFLTPTVADCATKEQAIAKIGGKLDEISAVAERELRANGYTYGAKASLGTGKGDNWWCVVYPPLCFTGGNANVIYKSKIAEIIRKFFA